MTIAIAMYNVAEYIIECLYSALKQDFEDYEVLLCDDNSTDNGLALVENNFGNALSKGLLRIIRHQRNEGTGSVRNTCMDNARGEYILFLDGDDYIIQNTISSFYEQMILTSADMVTANHQIFSVNNCEKHFTSTSQFKPGVIESEFALAYWMRENGSNYYPVALWNKMFRLSWLKNNNIRCKKTHTRQEDIFFAFETFFNVRKVVTLPDITLFWRMRAGSTMHIDVSESLCSQFVDIYDSCVIYLENYRRRYQNIQIPQEVYQIICRRYLGELCLYRVLWSRLLTIGQKQDYLEHISSMSTIGIKTDNRLFTRMERINYWALSSSRRYLYLHIILGLRTLFLRTKSWINGSRKL